MIYDIRHKTRFTYEDGVAVAHHVLHLVPRSHARQRSLQTALVIDPAPAVDSDGQDYFGNSVYYLTLQEPHARLVLVHLPVFDACHLRLLSNSSAVLRAMDVQMEPFCRIEFFSGPRRCSPAVPEVRPRGRPKAIGKIQSARRVG